MTGRGVVTMAPLFMLLLLLSGSAAMGGPRRHRERWEEGEGEWRPEEEGKGGGGEPAAGKGLFVLDKVEKVVDSEGGQVHVVRGQPWPPASFMHIGFITMEPKTLFVPQYMDSNLILFVQRGEVKVGWIHKDELVEKKLKMGDVLHIDAGSTFYMVNTGEGQRLQVICSIDASDSAGFGPYQSFYLGGAGKQGSVLGGFYPTILTTAFNTTYDELARIFTVKSGPIVFYTNTTDPGRGDKKRDAGEKERENDPWRPVGRGDEDERGNGQWTWSWRKLMGGFIGGAPSNAAEPNKKSDKTVSAPDPYNLFDHDPSFQNDYGWSVSIDKHDYEPLGHSDIGVYLVNLTAGSMMAPHVNPRATEYGVVLGGEGDIQVVFPNGTLAMSAKVRPGDVFWIPRYFPFAQVASQTGPFEFFGFTTSARRNRPQFLAGATSVLRTMLGPELAASFGVPEEELREVVHAQKDAVILPPVQEKEPRVIRQMVKE
ncbi:vicilin-like seed storage protein At2g28490 [Lolium rigidum]|uniref:vicilin-like seed storage protein At2g28490 n=1 Tax=Lolium rigidum TaxID=89674 RepID=UPI001F5D5F52|nr:vicilin-like seed storage protein At2g28490 [Lolium rigidum]